MQHEKIIKICNKYRRVKYESPLTFVLASEHGRRVLLTVLPSARLQIRDILQNETICQYQQILLKLRILTKHIICMLPQTGQLPDDIRQSPIGGLLLGRDEGGPARGTPPHIDGVHQSEVQRHYYCP